MCCPGAARLILTAPRSDEAVTLHRGACEKRLRDGKLATSSECYIIKTGPASKIPDKRHIVNADFRGAKSTHIPHRQLHSFSRNADALCEVIVHPIDPRATPLLRGRHPRHSLQEPSRTARQARAMAFRNAEGQRGNYLTLELSSTRNPVEDMYAVVSKFQSAKIGVYTRHSWA